MKKRKACSSKKKLQKLKACLKKNQKKNYKQYEPVHRGGEALSS